MRQVQRLLKKEIRPLEMIRGMITEEINQLELRGLEKHEDGLELKTDLNKCRSLIGSWINAIYDLK